jgi:hypothetical protein
MPFEDGMDSRKHPLLPPSLPPYLIHIDEHVVELGVLLAAHLRDDVLVVAWRRRREGGREGGREG